jgi:hypothetical protein
MNEGESYKLRGDNAMAILTVPDVVVLKTIHVDVQTVRVHVHVDHENVWRSFPSTAALTDRKETAEYYSGPKSPPEHQTNL